MMYSELKRAKILYDLKFSYAFSTQRVLPVETIDEKIDFIDLIQTHQVSHLSERLHKCLITPQKYDIGDSEKWVSLATIAMITILWDKLVDDINEAIKDDQIFNVCEGAEDEGEDQLE